MKRDTLAGRRRLLLDLDRETFRVLGGAPADLDLLAFAAEAALLAARDVLRVSSQFAREQQRELERGWLEDIEDGDDAADLPALRAAAAVLDMALDATGGAR